MLKRKVSVGKHPSTMKLRSKQSNLSQGNGLGVHHRDVPTPKTRFSLNDRPCSSPRLKSFPAEQMKRANPPPTKNPEGNMEISRQLQNSGQGDTLGQQSSLNSHSLPQSFALPNHNISSMSEQQVPHASCPVNQQVNQSEFVIPSPMGIASHERPPHRPHVPHTNMAQRDLSPKKPVSPQLTKPLQNFQQTQVVGSSEKEPNQNQHRDPRSIENDSVKCPAPGNGSIRDSDRYPGFFRRSVPANGSENINMSCPIPQRLIAAPNVMNICPVADGKPPDMVQPEQTYHRQQANMQHYHNNNVQSGMMRRQLVESNPTINSPQDIAINQNQNWQKPIQHNFQSQKPWVQNNGPQLQYYATNILTPGTVNPIATEGYQNINENEIQTGSNHHTTLQGYSQVQQQSYDQKNLTTSQMRPPPETHLKGSRGDRHQTKQDDKKKVLKFTPTMIKDQEIMVTTMRQQRIPEEIMRRQFDALLTEQRKQLLYLEQLERIKGESNNTKTAPQTRRVQRKISKIEEDGKPEWMLHITPPRIPYHVIEKMRTEKEVDSQQNQPAGNSVQFPPPDAQQNSYGQIVQKNCNQTWQQNGPNTWQQPSQYQPVPISNGCTIANVPNQQQTCSMAGHTGEQPQMRHYGFPMQYQHYMQQTPQEMGQGGIHRAQEDIKQAQKYQQLDKSSEPSSLLKLRLYKEVIRKQKQNNGLQDPETVREAMEALKNPANRKGLEYLDNLSKKPEKPVSLNGAQDPQEHGFLMNGSPPEQYLCQPTKMPSANGLENRRNSNKPTTSSLLHQKQIKESQWPEYPRQKVKSASRDCYSFIAEKENETVASSMPTDYHRSYPAMPQNPMMHHSMPSHPIHTEIKLENSGQDPGHLQQSVIYNNGKALADNSLSTPYTLTQQNQHQYHAGQMHQFHGNPSSYCQPNGPNRQPYVMPQPGCPPGGLIFKGNGNIQQQYCNINTEIQEMIMPGGLKYLARKPEYIPNSSAPPYQQNVHSGKYFNLPVPCQ